MADVRVAELFAGVGGFRLGLEGYDSTNRDFVKPAAGPFKTVWANQWEPPGTETKQFAARCYKKRFGDDSVIVEDIAKVLDEYEKQARDIPDVDMVVGGFPCQDYSVAKPLSKSGGIQGKKGVLWWSIYKFLQLKQPKYCLFENVDRLLKSPASARGRDFAIVLACLCSLGYSVEWRVVNSAEYGFPQRRKRVFIYAEKNAKWDAKLRLQDGVMSEALPIKKLSDTDIVSGDAIPFDVYKISTSYGGKRSPFKLAGVAVPDTDTQTVAFATADVVANYNGTFLTLGDVLVDESDVGDAYWVSDDKLARWEYLKGSKREERTTKDGYTYWYTEGSMAYPDLLTNPARTILTGEGGTSPSRFKHIICVNGKWRRLVPDELDLLQTFPKGWTDTGMSDNQRAFCMGNALVVGVVHRIGCAIANRL